MTLAMAICALLALSGCTDDPPGGNEGGKGMRDVSDFLSGHGPGAPAWVPADAGTPAIGGAPGVGGEPEPVSAPTPGVPAAGGTVRGEIRLSPGAAAPSGGVLFIIAKMPGAQNPAPIAVKRMMVDAFPTAYTLSAGDMMTTGQPFSGEMDVTARLDSDGNASTRGPGDLQGGYAGNPAKVGQTDVDIELGAP